MQTRTYVPRLTFRSNAILTCRILSLQFDEMIRARPQAGALGIGLRSIDALERLAKEHGGWVLEERKSVFRGNWVLVFRNAHTWTANVRAVCRSASNAAPPGLQDT